VKQFEEEDDEGVLNVGCIRKLGSGLVLCVTKHPKPIGHCAGTTKNASAGVSSGATRINLAVC